mmetsp:Transcript_27118/g.82187  ORF Transcript_27118/g.82187 Transcript_27118/m.82187 type:complete len:124 (-) Transcript_27118:325-696(-)|eukprot:scaffold142034_cov28-Tisochrysis_lutea.AAC.4
MEVSTRVLPQLDLLPMEGVARRNMDVAGCDGAASGNCGDITLWQDEHSTSMLLVAAGLLATREQLHVVQVKVNGHGRRITEQESGLARPVDEPPFGGRARTASMPERAGGSPWLGCVTGIAEG